MREIRDWSDGRHRSPPDEDWARRWLRALGVECEGDALNPALDSLDSEQWARMKAAWRNHKARRKRAQHYSDIWATRQQRLGGLWRRCIALGLVSEEDARTLAESLADTPMSGWGDAGCRFCMNVATGRAAETERANRGIDNAREMVAAAARMADAQGVAIEVILDQAARDSHNMPPPDVIAEARRLEGL